MNNLDLALVGNCTVGALVDARGDVVWGCFEDDGKPQQVPADRGTAVGERRNRRDEQQRKPPGAATA